MGKKKGKLILMSPYSIDWPKLDKDTEDRIITMLTQKFQEFPSLDSRKMKTEQEKSVQTAELPQSSLSQEEEDQRKARLRRQVVFGHRQVCKSLDWNQLSLIVVSGDAKPSILRRSLLPLVASRQCPALCVPSLHTPVTEALGLTSLLALGIKKPQPGEPNDFEDVVSLAASLAPPLLIPGMKCISTAAANRDSTATEVTAETPSLDSSLGQGENSVHGDPSATERGSSLLDNEGAKTATEKWSLMKTDQESELMDKLLELVKPFASVLQTPRSKLTPDQLQTRKNIKSCLTLDLGALRTAAHSGQLDLLLVNSVLDPTDLHPHPHPSLIPIIQVARDKGCSVLHVTSLRHRLGALVRDQNLRAVGFKKRPVVGLCREPEELWQFVSQYTVEGNADNSMATDTCPAEDKTAQSPTKGEKPKAPSHPAYDIASLYVYKSKSDNVASQKEANSLCETFISLSSEPTVQYLGVKSLGEGSAIADTAFIDCSGSGLSKKDLAGKKTDMTESSVGGGFTGIMGMDCVDASSASPPLLFPEVRRKKVKASLKRELDQSSDRGEFISFNIRPTNIQFSMPNSGKNKHKKFKKK